MGEVLIILKLAKENPASQNGQILFQIFHDSLFTVAKFPFFHFLEFQEKISVNCIINIIKKVKIQSFISLKEIIFIHLTIHSQAHSSDLCVV